MKLFMKYSTHLLTLFTICLCAWGFTNIDKLSAVQLVTVGFSVIITLHEWEEMHWPGGFIEMMGSIIGWDVSGIEPGAEHTSQSFFIALMMILPVLFPESYWLYCGIMVLGIFECIAHVAGIKMANTKKPYTPGMVTGILMMLYCVWQCTFGMVQTILGLFVFLIHRRE